jgi:hypothetical protein
MKVAGHPPNASEGRSMKYRMLGRTGIEGGNMAPGGERRSGL